MSLIIPANTLASGGFAVDNSLRFNSGSDDHLDKTFGQAGNRKTFTVSFWIKTTVKETYNAIFDTAQDGSNSDDIYFHTGRLNFSGYYGSTQFALRTTAKFRDPSAWSHHVIAFDTTQGTASNRIKFFTNGVQETAFDEETYPSLNFQTSYMNTARLHNIGTLVNNDDFPLDGYLSEFVFIDGSALAPTDFGEFDEDSGIWKPIDVSGLTFGTNGFYLDFEDSGALGADVSGNTNNFTVNNLTAIDQTTDTPTNNFATFNPLINTQNIPTFAEGNTQVTTTNGGVNGGYSTLGISSGKWFAEFKLTAFNTNRAVVGIVDNPSELDRTNTVIGESAYSVSYLGNGGNIVNNSSIVGSGSSYTTNDIIGVALNLDDNNILFYKNGAVQNSGTAVSITAASSTPTGFYFFAAADASTNYYATIQANFGNPAFTGTDKTDGNSRGSFEYAPPSGYLSLCTANLSEVLG